MIKIGNKEIGQGRPCFVIAEAGVNHNGKLAIAKKLVDAAASAGADAIKFQIFNSEALATKKAGLMKYAKKNLGKPTSQLEMLKKLELKEGEFVELKKYCDKKGILFLCTPHSGIKDVEFLESINVQAYKIGSGDLTNYPFLEFVAAKNKPIFLSTGMADMAETKEAVERIRKSGNDKIVVMHCTTSYPCRLEEANLRVIPEIKNSLGVLAGYSDHTQSTIVPALAVCIGACAIEKHFTISRNLAGPDHRASFEPLEIKTMLQNIRDSEKALGSSEKKPTKTELNVMHSVRKSIIAEGDIPKGAIIKKENICIKRPGTGLSPDKLELVLGKETKRKIRKDKLISLSDLK